MKNANNVNLFLLNFKSINYRFYCTRYVSGPSIYNPLSKSKVPVPVNTTKGYLSWYSCGPTVYDTSHIGHASCYVRLDIIRRVLSCWFGLKPVVAMGVTDIDDKIITRAKLQNVDCSVIAKKYEVEFFEEMQKLNVEPPHIALRVSEHIPEIINFIEIILSKGHGYVLGDGSVYFNTQSLNSYGKVTRAPVLESKPSEPGGRKHPADFALWKASKPGEPSWPSPWSNGRPGWHIECSAMASKIFGNHLDIHTGGLDLAFPHHENEEAQSCAHHAVAQWVEMWIHTGHMLMNGVKMSKSMKNFIPISKFLEQNSADQFRMLCLMTQYRTSIDFSPEVMKKAVTVLDKFNTFLKDARSYQRGTWGRGKISPEVLHQELQETDTTIRTSLADDINTAQCINRLEELVKVCNVMLHKELDEAPPKPAAIAIVADFVQECLQNLGLLQQEKRMANNSEYLAEKILAFRSQVRQLALLEKGPLKKKLLEECDLLRSDLQAIGISVKDSTKLPHSKHIDN